MKETEITKIKVKLIRPIRWEGKKLDQGEVMELGKPQAMELVANGKATMDLKFSREKAEKPAAKE